MPIKPNIKQFSEHEQDAFVYQWHNPGRALGRDGCIIDTKGENWILHDETVDTQINWELIKTASDIKDAMKAFVFYKVESQTAQAAWTVFNCIKYFAQELKHINSAHELTFAEMQNFLNAMRNQKYEWRFGHVRRWYEWCCRREITGFDDKLSARLKKLKVRSLMVGQSVLNRDPNKGPFTDEEFRLIRQAVKEKKGTLVARVCIMLLLELGARPAQLVLLDETDFRVFKSPEGKEFYSLDITRMKQRIVGKPEKKQRRITAELAEQISLLIADNQRIYGSENKNRPLLHSETEKSDMIETPSEIPGERWRSRRMTRPMMLYHVREYASRTGIVSPRTGKILQMFPYRLRYTFATRHANQGTPAAALAEMLDHSVLEGVRVYTKGTSGMVEHLNEALGKNEQFTGIIDLFAGKIQIKTKNDAAEKLITGTTPTLKSLGGIGVCGADYLCNLYPPLSCYVCPKFIAWKDGPHEAMIRELETYVEQLAEKSGNPSDRIPHQLKETILAVKALLTKSEN